MRKVLILLLVLPFLVFGAPSAQAATCTIDPQDGPVTGQVGTELTFFITVTGCASSNKQPSFKVVDGRVPTGMKVFDFAGSSGLVNGVPRTAGTFTFTVQVTDETRATDTETFTIEIQPAEPPTITTQALSNGMVGEFYCCGNLFASGGVQPYTWSVVAGALPPGLELPKRENTISGTPTTAGTFTFTVRVTDDAGAFSEKELSITIS
ncbi:Ig domain-containing protein [Arthrobacter sp. ZGTC131]|uniref:Ig domain-containing protein n=1 Tax=Arthrobacter sp. ZGTC131 TaxID=2058898 RepID=UPI000CE4FC76|nr:Ig domain-containing protein [Arthrobacter sp. ZGTC131]